MKFLSSITSNIFRSIFGDLLDVKVWRCSVTNSHLVQPASWRLMLTRVRQFSWIICLASFPAHPSLIHFIIRAEPSLSYLSKFRESSHPFSGQVILDIFIKLKHNPSYEFLLWNHCICPALLPFVLLPTVATPVHVFYQTNIGHSVKGFLQHQSA